MSTPLDDYLAALEPPVREAVLRWIARYQIPADDPNFVLLLMTADIVRLTETVPATMAEATGQASERLRAVLADLAATLERHKDGLAATVIQGVLEAQADGLRSAAEAALSRRLDSHTEQLDSLTAIAAAAKEAVNAVRTLPAEIANTTAERTMEHLPASLTEAVAKAIGRRIHLYLPFVAAFFVLATSLGGGLGWLAAGYRARVDHDADVHQAVLQQLGADAPLVQEAAPFKAALEDPLARERLQWASANPAIVDLMRSDRGPNILALVRQYRGYMAGETVPYPCLAAGPQVYTVDRRPARTCVVIAPKPAG